jgi:hypothetical protein
MAVIYLCDRCNVKSENTFYCEYEGYRCGDIITFDYLNKEGEFEEVELCYNYSEVEENTCLREFKKENNIMYVKDDKYNYWRWKVMPDAS